MAKRSRGKGYPCVCREEQLRDRRSDDPAVGLRTPGGWVYLFGKCRGGVKFRYGPRGQALEITPVEKEEAERVKATPARVDPRTSYERLMERLDEKTRRRLEAIAVTVEQKMAAGLSAAYEIGDLLLEAKDILKHGDFGLWVDRRSLDRAHAHKFMRLAELVQANPKLTNTFVKMGQEKTVLLTRLSPAKRQELIDDGVSLNGGPPKPLIECTYRELNQYVRAVNGKDPRGRKRTKPEKAARPTERFGMPIHIVDAFQAAAAGLSTLEQAAKERDFRSYGDEAATMIRLWWETIEGAYAVLVEEHAVDEIGWVKPTPEGRR